MEIQRLLELQSADGELMQLIINWSEKYHLSFSERIEILSRTISRDAQYEMRKKRKHG